MSSIDKKTIMSSSSSSSQSPLPSPFLLGIDNHHHIYEKLNNFLSIEKIPNIIFHGPSGSGKRNIVKQFLYKIYDDDKEKINTFVMIVDCVQGAGIGFIRDELKFFAKTNINYDGGKTFKSIILLNADKLTIDAQSALRCCIERFHTYNKIFYYIRRQVFFVKTNTI